jgi:ATP-dependent HslUV protease ATP-binding subunit HslU
MPLPIESLTPTQIVAELDQHVVGQNAAKRAIAVALRNRFRRQQLEPHERADVMPKNILMIGPTGVGKTEIARRVARLARAPFVKVEATKFTEVGYVGRDVDSIIRELVAQAVRLVEIEKTEAAQEAIERRAEERLLDLLEAEPAGSQLFSFGSGDAADDEDDDSQREVLRDQLRAGELEDREIELEVEEANNPFMQVFTPGGIEEMGIDTDALGGAFGSKRRYRKATIAEARRLVFEQTAKQEVDSGAVRREAIERTEQTGIVFIDEIDKVAGANGGSGPDVSREGVQRDLLPIIEGSTVQTKFGPIRTDHILFIAAGAFHNAKPSDLIPELQGRLPIRVQLHPLGKEDFRRILSEPKASLVKQYQKLLEADGVSLSFTDDALSDVAAFALKINESTMDIGARRLHTILERLLEPYLFSAPDPKLGRIELDGAAVKATLLEWEADAERGIALL